MKQTKCSSIRTDSNSAIMVFTYPDDKTGLEGDTKVEIEIGGKTIELTESQLNVISDLYQSSIGTRRNKYYTEAIERGEQIEEMGQ